MSTADITGRQADALAWLDAVGKATSRSLRAAGFQERTFEALVDLGLVEHEYRFAGPDSFHIYRPPS